MKHTNDSGGYTLQTIIVSAILLVVATTASVALYRAITTSADVRSFADLTSEGDERTPTTPRNFTVDYDIVGSNYNAIINWAASSYTGAPQLGGSTSELRYDGLGYCQPPKTNLEPPPSTTTTTTPLQLPFTNRKATFVEANISSTSDLDCKVQINAYHCPPSSEDPSEDKDCEDTRKNQRISGPESEFEFALRRVASAPRNPSIKAVGDRWLISWDTPQNKGDNSIDKNLYYKVEGYKVAVEKPKFGKCTFSNFLLTESNSDPKDFTIIVLTSYVFTSIAEKSVIDEIEANRCPTDVNQGEADGTSSIRVELGYTSVPGIPVLEISLATKQELGEEQPTAISLVNDESFADIVIAKLEWDRIEEADSYILEWFPTNGDGLLRSEEIGNTEDQNVRPKIFLRLENGMGYNFSLWAQNSLGTNGPWQGCYAVSTDARPLKPDFDSEIVTNTRIFTRIDLPNLANSCVPREFCTSISPCNPEIPRFYKIRIFESTSNCQNNNLKFPDEKCSDRDHIVCIPANSSTIEVIIDLPTVEPGYMPPYIIESIASVESLCEIESDGDTLSPEILIEYQEAKPSIPTILTIAS